jgi:hypothetical protein
LVVIDLQKRQFVSPHPLGSIIAYRTFADINKYKIMQEKDVKNRDEMNDTGGVEDTLNINADSDVAGSNHLSKVFFLFSTNCARPCRLKG